MQDSWQIGSVPSPWTSTAQPVTVLQCDGLSVDHVRDRFESELRAQRSPLLLRGLTLGLCTNRWCPEYLAQTVGDRKVQVHATTASCMTFAPPNFRLCPILLSEMIERVGGAADKDCDNHYGTSATSDGVERYYLRALHSDKERSQPARFDQDFAELAADLSLPQLWPCEAFFSSVLRISSARLRLWAHYDVMDNILVQVCGHKRVLLFRPCDASDLYLRGDKSAVADLEQADLARWPNLTRLIPLVAHLRPGDALFIPALWFHSVTAHEFSVAVNVFWRHLAAGSYQPKDVFGNKDPLPATQALTTLKRALRHLSTLPEEYRDFYGRRMIAEVENTALKGFLAPNPNESSSS